MTRPIRPLVIILGFSVFCACTTTKTIPQSDLRRSVDGRNTVVVLRDGARLEVRTAPIDAHNVRGHIAKEDSSAFAPYVVSGRAGVPMLEVHVLIPRSDGVEVQFHGSSKALSMAVGFFAVCVWFGVLLFTRR